MNRYAAEFTRLSRFVSYMVDAEEAKVDRFRERLDNRLKHNVALCQLNLKPLPKKNLYGLW